MTAADFDTSDRVDSIGPIKLLARASGYVMVRRPRAMPFVLSEQKWSDLERLPRERGQ